MNITCVAHRYWPHVGGVERYMHELAKALVAMGHTVRVIAGDTTGQLAPRDVRDGVSIHRFPASRSPARCRLWFLRHRHLLTRADVVHVSNTHMLEYVRRMLGRIVDRRKLFLTRHGMSLKFPVPASERIRARWSLHHCAGVIHDGAFIARWLHVEPDLCVDQGLNPEADALPEIPEPPPRSAVYIGRLEPDTGIRTYIDAVRILNHTTRHWPETPGPRVPALSTSSHDAAPTHSDPRTAHHRPGDQLTANPYRAMRDPYHELSNPYGAMCNRDSDMHNPYRNAFTLDVYGDGSLGAELRAVVTRESLPVFFHGRIPAAQDRFVDACFAFVDGRMAIHEAMARRRLVLAAYDHQLKRDYVCGERFSPYLVAVGGAGQLADRVAYFAAHEDKRRSMTDGAFAYARRLSWPQTALAYERLWRARLAATPVLTQCPVTRCGVRS